MSRGAPLAAALLPALFAVACGRTETAAVGSGSLAGRNVLLTLIDSAAAPRLSAYGASRPTTPYLASFGAAAVRFDDVTAAAPYTLASVAALFSGEHVDAHQVIQAGDPLPATPLLAERFDDAGYRTFGLSNNAHVHERFGFARGFDHFQYLDPRVGQVPHHVVPPELLEQFGSFLDEPAPAPFFAYLHLMPPHAPYDPPAAVRRLFTDGDDAREGQLDYLIALSAGALEPSPAERQRVIDLYDAGLRYADEVLAAIGAELERRGRLEDTLWVVLSDHGEAFGERGVWQHSKLVQESMLRVPLLLRWPGGRAPCRAVREAVSLVDLHPTLAELCDLAPQPRETSVSLVPLLAGGSLERRPPIVARTAGPGPFTSLRRGALKATFSSQRRHWTLHDVERDFAEEHDLAAERPADLERLRAELQVWWERHRPAAADRDRIPLTDELREHLERIGYR